MPKGKKSSDPFIGFVSPYREDLLRVGTSSAMVRALITHKDKLILIERRLNGDTGGRITILSDAGGTLKTELSSSYSSEDLTEKILELLNLREDPRKGRSTYVFSNVMYVPQFNVHQVLVLDDKQRRELVNKVLGLDKYTAALNNIEKIAKGKNSVIGSELDNINKVIEDRRKILEKINVNELKARLSELRRRRDELDKTLRELRGLRESLEARREEFSAGVSELSLRIGELRNKVKVINEKEKELESKRRRLDAILSEIGLSSVGSVSELSEELKRRKSSLENEYSDVSKKIRELDEKLKSVEASEREILAQVSRLEAEIENIKSRVREVWGEVQGMRELVARGVCPLCRQSITREHGEELVKEKNAKMREAAKDLVPLIKELRAKKLLQLRLSSEKEEIKKMRAELSKRQEEILRELREVDAGILRLSQITELSNEISRLEREVSEKTKILEELSVAEREFENLSKRIDDLRSELSRVKEREVECSRRLGEVSDQIVNLEEKLREHSELSSGLRELESRASFLKKISEYLINYVYKGVETIESAVRALAHDRFSEYFQEYFVRLLEDQELVEASVRDFKPSVKVRGSFLREQEISQPSGAQLTALGLAYRLALNRVVRDLNKELRDSVLIMDEPTLGFSPERIEKLRDLIESIRSDLGEAQVILVTHDERLLEVGDCRIRLSVDHSRNETLVDYEECVTRDENLDFQQYKNTVSRILSR